MGGYGIWKWQFATSYPPEDCSITRIGPNNEQLLRFTHNQKQRTFVEVDCRSPRKGDLVAFRTPLRRNLVVKKVAKVPGDELQVNEQRGVRINDKDVFRPDGETGYTLKNERLRTMQRYVGTLEGYIVIGNEGSLDSSRFGTLSREAIQYVLPQNNI